MAPPLTTEDARSLQPSLPPPSATHPGVPAMGPVGGVARDAALGSRAERVRVPIVEERLRIERRRRVRRVVRLRQRTEMREEVVVLDHVHESVRIERQAVGEVVAVAMAPYQEGDVLVIPVYEEQIVTERRLVLRELVRVHRDREVVPETVVVTLRRGIVEIDETDVPAGSDAASPLPDVPPGTSPLSDTR